MRLVHNLAALLPLLLTTQATVAPVMKDNPAGIQYVAVLPDKNDTTVRGTVQISSAANGTGVNIQVSISGMAVQGGPYKYHIHQNQAPALDCGAAGGHLDPYNVTDSAACDPLEAAKCQVGDLSGKHGSMSSTSYSANYVDLYLSTKPGTAAFVGNRSLVVHFANDTRVSCANFTMPGAESTGSAQPVTTSTVTVTYNAATAVAPTVASYSAPSSAISLSTVTTILTILTAPQGTPSMFVTTQTLTTYAFVPQGVLSSLVSTTTVPYLMSQSSQTPQVSTQAVGFTSTTTSTIMSMVVVIPPHPSTQTISSKVTLTQSSNVTLVSALAQPYTIVGTSTILATLVQPSTQTLTLGTSIMQTTLLPGATQDGQGSIVTAQPAATQTVLTTLISTVTLTAGATMPTALTVTAPVASTSPGSTVTITSTSGNLLATISTFIFGAPTTTATLPTTLTVTPDQPLAPSIVSQIVQLVSLPPTPGIATVLNIVSVPTGTVPSNLVKTLTSVIATPSNITTLLSVVTANGLISTITQPLGSLPTAKITATSIVNVALPIATNVPPLIATTTTITSSTRTKTGKPTTITSLTRTIAGQTTRIPTKITTILAQPPVVTTVKLAQAPGKSLYMKQATSWIIKSGLMIAFFAWHLDILQQTVG